MSDNEVKKGTGSKKRKKKHTLLESIHLTKKKAEKISEEKQKIEQEEIQIKQGQSLKLKEIYDKIFKNLNIDIEEIILTSENEDEIIWKVKERLGIV